MNLDTIARTLTREGIPTPTEIVGKKNAGLYWHGSTVKLILSNPHFVGDLVQCRETTTSVNCKKREKLPHDKQILRTPTLLLSREDFEAVQRYMEARNTKRLPRVTMRKL